MSKIKNGEESPRRDPKIGYNLSRLKSKLSATTSNPEFNFFTDEMLTYYTGQHIKKIQLRGDSEIMAVSNDPKTFEMRRDLHPELKKMRFKALKKDFRDQIKMLKTLNVSKAVIDSKLELLQKNQDVLKEYNGQITMENILNFKVKLIEQK